MKTLRPLPIEPIDLIAALREIKPYVYVATPYSKYPGGIEEAFRAACEVSAWLIKQRVRLYCPIAHAHPIAMAGLIDPHDHAIWLPADKPFMDGAGGIVTVMMPTWQDSYGIEQENMTFFKAGKPCLFMNWPREDTNPEARQP